MIRKVLEMTNRNEIRKAHEIVDKIYPLYEREALRKLLPPRPEFTFGDAIQALKGLASEDDVHLWKIIGHLERLEKEYTRASEVKETVIEVPVEEFPEGSLAVRDGACDVWVKGSAFWSTEGSVLHIDDDRVSEGGFRILRYGFYNA